MQLIVGKDPRTVDASSITRWAAGYSNLAIDLGTGDGSFVRHLAIRQPSMAVIGVDTCGANALNNARRAPENARFVVLDALSLPNELVDLATRITINFPWGSLLRALLDGDERLLSPLSSCPVEIRVNAGALAEQGHDFESGVDAMRRSLRLLSPGRLTMEYLDRFALRAIPTTWSKRLAFGRDPKAMSFVITR